MTKMVFIDPVRDSGAGDDPRRPGEEGRQVVTETDALPIRLRLALGPARNASDRSAREQSDV